MMKKKKKIPREVKALGKVEEIMILLKVSLSTFGLVA